jgi:hypothetical protein
MGFNLAFKGLNLEHVFYVLTLKLSQAGCGETTVGRPAYAQDTRENRIVM